MILKSIFVLKNKSGNATLNYHLAKCDYAKYITAYALRLIQLRKTQLQNCNVIVCISLKQNIPYLSLKPF